MLALLLEDFVDPLHKQAIDWTLARSFLLPQGTAGLKAGEQPQHLALIENQVPCNPWSKRSESLLFGPEPVPSRSHRGRACLRTASTLPDYSDQELRQALGNLSARIQNLFRVSPGSTQGGESGAGSFHPGA